MSERAATSLGAAEVDGPLRRERLRTARLYFVCEALPGGEDPERLLRAALDGGVDIVQLREKALRPRTRSNARRATFRRLATPTAPCSSSTTTPPGARPAAPTASTSARTTPPPRRPARSLGPDASSASPPTPRSSSPPRPREPVDYVSVGPVWETPTKRGGPAVGLELVEHAAASAAPTRSSRSAASTPRQRRRGRRGRGAAARRRAGDPRRGRPRRGGRGRCARRCGRRDGASAAPGALSGEADASASARRRAARRPTPRRADGARLRRAPRSATGEAREGWSRWPRASGRSS